MRGEGEGSSLGRGMRRDDMRADRDETMELESAYLDPARDLQATGALVAGLGIGSADGRLSVVRR